MSRTSHQTKSQKRNLLGVSSRLRRASPLTLITQSTFGFEFRGIHHGFQKGPFRPFGLTFPPHHSLRAQPRSPGVLPSMLDVVLWSPLSPRPSRPESPSPLYVFSVADVRYPSRLVAVPQLLLACNVCVRNLINISVRY